MVRYEGLTPGDAFSRSGWFLAMVRGLAASAAGALLAAWGSASVLAVMIAFGSCAVFCGAALELESMLALSRRKLWGFQAALAAVGLVAGIMALGKPRVSPHAALYLASAWMVATGAVAMAWGLETAPLLRAGRMKSLGGAVAVAAGFLLMLFPDSGIRTTALVLGVTLLLTGLAESAFSLLLRSALKD